MAYLYDPCNPCCDEDSSSSSSSSEPLSSSSSSSSEPCPPPQCFEDGSSGGNGCPQMIEVMLTGITPNPENNPGCDCAGLNDTFQIPVVSQSISETPSHWICQSNYAEDIFDCVGCLFPFIINCHWEARVIMSKNKSTCETTCLVYVDLYLSGDVEVGWNNDPATLPICSSEPPSSEDGGETCCGSDEPNDSVIKLPMKKDDGALSSSCFGLPCLLDVMAIY